MELLVYIHMNQVKILIFLTYIIDNAKKYEKIIGIGETGLDFYYNHC